jgi:hypothetical protein
MKIMTEESWRRHLAVHANDVEQARLEGFRDGKYHGVKDASKELESLQKRTATAFEHAEEAKSQWEKKLEMLNTCAIEEQDNKHMVVMKTTIASYTLTDDFACKTIAGSLVKSAFGLLVKQMELKAKAAEKEKH